MDERQKIYDDTNAKATAKKSKAVVKSKKGYIIAVAVIVVLIILMHIL